MDKKKNRNKTLTIFAIVLLMGACGGNVFRTNFTSTVAAGYEPHVHTIIMDCTAFYVVAPGGVVLTTTRNATPEHSHTVTITEANYQAIVDGETIVLTTDADGTGHDHDFRFRACY